MKTNFYLYLFLLVFLLSSCSKEELKKTTITEKNLESQVYQAYNEGMLALEEGDVLFAAKKFNEAEILFPQSILAPKAALMAAYSYYVQDYYDDSIAELIRFKKIYPNHYNLDYANYLLGICYYEQIVDEKKDTQSVIKSREQFQYLINQYPNTEYALDAEFKLDLINDILASKEMYIGRYYFDKKKWIPAINRFRTVVDDYGTTIYVEEALHRLVEVHYVIGLTDEAKKYAKLLGYNYQSSKWYERSYGVFNKMYAKKNIEKEKQKNSILVKIKSLFSSNE